MTQQTEGANRHQEALSAATGLKAMLANRRCSAVVRVELLVKEAPEARL